MLIDCESCRMRDTDACEDCVVSVLFSDTPLDLDQAERKALDNLARAGLVPRLRLLPPDRQAG